MRSTFKRSIWATMLFAMVVTLGNSEAKADEVTFSTSGIFTCELGVPCTGGGTNSVTIQGTTGGTLTFTYIGAPSTTLNTPSFASLGSFQVSVTGTGAGVSNIPFVLTINQTGPTAGSGSFIPALVGGLFTSSSSGLGIVTFQIFPSNAPIPPVTIGGFSYSVFTTFNDIHLVPPASNNGITTVQGFVSGSAPEQVPEPATMLLLLTGLAGAGVVKKRFQS